MLSLRRHSRACGFSLVEVMVGIVIAMIASLVMLQVFATFEDKKRSTSSGSDAQTEGAIATFGIERDVRMAGYGINTPELLGCRINSSYEGTASNFTLAPLTITNGANGLPDTIRVLASSKKKWSVPARVINNHPPEATNMFLNTSQGIDVGDMLIAYEPGKDCTLMQVTGIPNGTVQIHHQNTSPWNPPGGQNIFPKPDGYTTKALLFNLGSFLDRTYSVDVNSNLRLSIYHTASNSSAAQSLVAGVVNLQAQYGFDTRLGLVPDRQVTQWSDTMIDANGNGIVGDAGDIQRIYAARIAVVTRSAHREKPKSDGTCAITTASSNNRPVWSGGDIDVSKKADGSAISDWTCYRYRVLETVVPLRNMLWGETQL